MSFKTITAILLVSCLGATGSSLGVSEEPPQDARVAALPPVLTITDVRWTLTETSTTVQICTADDLPVGLPSLGYNDGINPNVDAEGEVIDVNTKCVTFSQEVPYKFTDKPSRYELIVTDKSDPFSFLGRGVTTFAITVKTTLLTCSVSNVITKITWSAEEVIPTEFCVGGSSTLDKACYHNGDLTGTELCFTVNDGVNDVNVWLNGPIDVDASTSTGTVSTKYFYYGPDSVNNEPAEATLSLTMDTLGGNHLRAIVRLADDPDNPGTPGKAHIYDCPSSECKIPLYPRDFAEYEVCVEAMDDVFETKKTAITTFTDLNLNAFDGGSQKSTLLELVFANGLEPRNYVANLYEQEPSGTFGDTSPINTANLDCTSVMIGHACFGFVDTTTATVTPVYLALSATDDTYTANTNTIIVPYTNTIVLHEPLIGHQ